MQWYAFSDYLPYTAPAMQAGLARQRGLYRCREATGDATASHPLPCLATPRQAPCLSSHALLPLAPKHHAVALFASLVRGLSWAPDHRASERESLVRQYAPREVGMRANEGGNSPMRLGSRGFPCPEVRNSLLAIARAGISHETIGLASTVGH